MRVRPAIDKIFEEQPDIFTNKDVFYTLCKRLALVFEPIKRVINFLESHTANLADCFVEIAQIAASFKRIHPSNDLCAPAIASFNFQYHELVCQLIKYKAGVAPWNLEYSSNLTPALWWGVVEDEHTHLQELAKTMFAIAPSQANCGQNFLLLKWFSEGRHTRLQVPRLESMAQIYSFYVSNIKQGLNFYDKNFEEAELYSSVINETIFAEVNNNGSNKDKDEIEIEDLIATDITKVLQDLVDLSDPIFGANNKEEITLIDEEETTMEFDSRSLVQDVLSDDDLYE
ncbi:28659_t:CDS:2 [Gigaspora margarita]|uniref:28659_t:CDS:1 n=1 Tax=Gigaspora margarita TaxID=4874 RepID=A0ABM8VY20_GIGMA|nr:28659_t:CDS:2 [Gigaspora margarita]